MMIDIEELKKDITDNTFDIRTLVCVCKDDTSRFIAMQYYHHYARQNKLNVELLEEMPNSVGTPFGELDTLYVCEVGTLEEIPLVQNSANLWIICEKIKKGFTPENYIRFPKLEEWQIQDYIITQTNVTEEQADLLMKTYKDIRKLDIEMQKLVIFRQEMFDELEAQLIYTEDKPIYDLVNALVERNKAKLQEAVKEGVDDIEPFKLVAVLKNNLKTVIDIQLAKNATAETLGISGKQFWVINKYKCYKYDREELLHLYDFILGIDSRIKSGQVDTTNVVNHIIGRFLQFMR